MSIGGLTVPELNRYRELCNFLDDELMYFNMKSRGKSNTQIAIALSISSTQCSRVAERVKDKMERVDFWYFSGKFRGQK